MRGSSLKFVLREQQKSYMIRKASIVQPWRQVQPDSDPARRNQPRYISACLRQHLSQLSTQVSWSHPRPLPATNLAHVMLGTILRVPGFGQQ